MNNRFLISLLLLTTIIFATIRAQTKIVYEKIDINHTKITVYFQLKNNDLFYRDYFAVSSNNPHIAIDSWHITPRAVDQFDADFKEVKKVYAENPVLEIIASCQQPCDGTIHVDYYQKSKKRISSLSIPLHQKQTDVNDKNNTEISAPKESDDNNIPSKAASTTPSAQKVTEGISWTDYSEDLLRRTDSLWIRMLFALLLGLLLSLTPCIYPMIPITVGVLQAQGSPSFFRNFLVALSYTVGVATTFALLGLSAAFTGQIFGSLLGKPLFVFGIVAVLLYLAGSMIGFYEMYIPSFLNAKNSNVKGGSIISSFLFGAVTGTIASPCLSPGLVLLLTLVTTIGSKIVGFFLLFAFGVGLSIPLLVIGTFSNSITLLPSAGIWMVEVKKFFGFIMVGMCFFYLKNVVAWTTLSWVIAATVLATGIFYIYQATIVPGWKKRYNALGTILVACSVFLFFKAYQTMYPIVQEKENHISVWYTDFEQALQAGREHHKRIFVKIGAPYCSICKTIDKSILAQKEVADYISTQFIPFIIDNKAENEAHKQLQDAWGVRGVPVFFIINAENGERVHRFGSEIANWPRTKFMAMLEQWKR